MSRRTQRRRKRRKRRGGQNYGSAMAKQSMTKKGRSTIGRFGSTRSGKRFGLGISKKKSRLGPPPKRKAPRPGNRSGPDPIVWRTNPLFKGKTRKQFIKEQKKMTKKMKARSAARPSWRETAAIGSERKLAKYYGNNRSQTKLGNVQAKGNAAWGAAGATSAFRRSAWDARKKKELNVGKKAANTAATKVVAVTKAAANQAAKQVTCPSHCVPTATAGGRRRRRRRRTRR